MSGAAGKVEWLWTWSGAPFGTREGDDLWTHDGRHVGRFQGDSIYGPDGRYVGELMGNDRLIVAKFRHGLRRAGFTAQPRRTRSPRPNRMPGYQTPIGHEDFPLPEKLP